MSLAALSFVHRFRPAERADPRPLLLLHGTGGDEADLPPLGGAPRFFRRLAEGVFDESDVRRRAGDLAEFVARARRAYGLAAPLAVGFSNGANIAAAIP